jgi:hypothetical protein
MIDQPNETDPDDPPPEPVPHNPSVVEMPNSEPPPPQDEPANEPAHEGAEGSGPDEGFAKDLEDEEGADGTTT